MGGLSIHRVDRVSSQTLDRMMFDKFPNPTTSFHSSNPSTVIILVEGKTEVRVGWENTLKEMLQTTQE